MSEGIPSGLRDIISRDLPKEATTYALLDLTLQTTLPDVADAVRVCAIPGWFDACLLALLIEKDEEEAASLVDRIAAFSFVLPREERGGYVYYGPTRTHLLNWWREPDHHGRFAALSDRLAQYYLALVREQYRHPSDPDHLEVLGVLDAEYPNIRVAQAWVVEKGDWELVRDYAYTLADYFQHRGMWAEWITWTKAGLEGCERAGDVESSARMQNNLGVAYRNLPIGDRASNLKQAIAYYLKTLRVYTLEARPFGYAMIQNNLGNVYADLADLESGDRVASLQKAIECYQEALHVYTPEATPLEYAMTQDNLNVASIHLVTEDRADDEKTTVVPRTVTWLHLSDLHFRESCNYDEGIILEAFLDDVAERISEDGLQPDFIVVSGDIAFASRPEEYALARQFFEDLLKATDLPRNRLFLVPGNHDVDRKAVSTLAAGAPDILTNRGIVNRLLTDDADRALIFRRFHNYRDFVNEYLGKEHIPFDDSRYFYVKVIEVSNRHVAILGLNSAWLACSDEDRNRIVLGERQVRAALNATRDAELRLAITHHPFDWLNDFDQIDAKSLLCGGCKFVLHGHMHQVGLLQARTPDTEAMIIAAGACYETRDYPNSYNFVQLDLNTGRGKVYLRMYSDLGGGFWTKDVLNYHNMRDGEYAFVLA